MALDRAQLIGGLAAEFDKDKGVGGKIDKSNYIEPTNSLDCTALGLPIETLTKTRNVAVKKRDAYKAIASKDPEATQMVLHLDVAIKCIDQIISEKAKG